MSQERTEPCKQCGNFDWYYRGEFSYCRFCHKEAQQRYINKLSSREHKPLPKRDLEYLISKGNSSRDKLYCPAGHRYDSENTRINTQRKGKHINRKCRACQRNAKRVKYGVDPEPAPTKLTDLLDS